MSLINVKERKRQLRAKYKKLRESCPPDVRKRLDERLTEQFLRLDEFRECQTLFAFLSMPVECDTYAAVAKALELGKRVAVPKCVSRRGDMDFYYISSFDDISRGMYGVMEPDPQKCVRVTEFDSGLCMVPGICFDLSHYRIGFGKGYYDRFLDIFGGTTAGICYSRYVVGEIPRGAFDRRTDILVTEKFIDRSAR